MDHLQRVKQEFTRQAESFAASAAITDVRLTDRFVEAIGPCAELRTLVRALARVGEDAGMGLALSGSEVVFFHRWQLIAARKSRG